MTNSINFQAKFIQTAQIKKFNYSEFKYNPLEVAIVKLDRTSKSDVDAVRTGVRFWKNDLYGRDIAEEFRELYYRFLPKTKQKYYAITTQTDNFEKLDGNKIIGLTEIENQDGRMVLKFIQTNPNTRFHNGYRKFTGIGTAMLNFLKQNNIPIFLNSDVRAVTFYLKNNFSIIDDFLTLNWIPNKKNNIN